MTALPTLDCHQTQKLIDLKNSMIEKSEEWYDWASIQQGELDERADLIRSSMCEQFAKELEKIIYKNDD